MVAEHFALNDRGTGTTRRRVLRVVTRCSTREQFLDLFGPHADQDSLFIFTNSPRPVGTRQWFLIQLATGEPMMRGECEIIECHTHGEGPQGRNGIRIRLLVLDVPSREMHRALLAHRPDPAEPTIPEAALPQSEAQPLPRPGTQPLPLPPTPSRVTPQPDALRTPGASDVLPANPFGDLAAESLLHFVECTIYEDTGGIALPGGSNGHGHEPAMVMPFPMAAPVPDALDAESEATTPGEAAPGGLRTRHRWALAATGLLASALGIAVGYVIRDVRLVPRRSAAAAPPPARRADPASAPAPPPTDPSTQAPIVPPCAATVTSDPPGVDVIWEGERIGVTPLAEVPVPCGSALVVLAHPHYRRAKRQLLALPDQPASWSEQMVAPDARLDLSSKPPGARFVVDGKLVGRAPTYASVTAYSHVTVSAHRSGYRRWSRTIYVESPLVSVQAELEPSTHDHSQ